MTRSLHCNTGDEWLDGHVSRPQVEDSIADKVITLRAENQRLREEVERLQVENEELKKPSFYTDEYGDIPKDTLDDLVICYAVGTINEVHPAHALPKFYVLITEDGFNEFDTYEAAEEASEK